MKSTVRKYQQQIGKELYQRNLQPNPARLAHTLDKLFAYDTGLFFSNLAKIPAAELCYVLLELSSETFAEALQRLSIHKLYHAMTMLPSSDATDFMQRLSGADAAYGKQLYALLNPVERSEIRELSRYDETQAGAYMETEVLTAMPEERIAAIKSRIRAFQEAEPHSPIVKLFVTDGAGRLIATLHFSELILFEPEQTIAEVLSELKPHRPLTIRPTSPVEEVIRLFDEYDLSAVGVVNSEGVLKGRILYDDIYELIRDYETDQAYKLAGVDDAAEEENITSARKKRLIWLMVNLVTILGASFVIGLFEATIASYIALAILLPVVAALGGNAGMQAMTVTVRRLALGEIDPSQAYPVLKREAAIVMVNGMAVALTVAAVAWFWFGNAMLCAVIALAIFLNLLVAGSVGALIPLGLKRIGIDPAVASSVLLTTTSDVFGFFIFLFLAERLL